MSGAFRDRTKPSVFLAGSIEMGKADPWQDKIADWSNSWNVFNPRRDDWDSTWTQEAENPNFYQQVYWELSMMHKADYILFFFQPDTKSPISLLELGIHAMSGKCFVACPKEFWRSGNVEMTCNFYDIPLFDSVLSAAQAIKRNYFSKHEK